MRDRLSPLVFVSVGYKRKIQKISFGLSVVRHVCSRTIGEFSRTICSVDSFLVRSMFTSLNTTNDVNMLS
jgi:hypothetical protein